MSVLGSVAVLIASVSVFAFAPIESVDAKYAAYAQPSNVDIFACMSECVSCNDDMGHQLQANSEGPLTNDPATEPKCIEFDPCDHHSVCEPEETFASHDPGAAVSETLRLALWREDEGGVAELMRAYPEYITVNDTRLAVQLLDCGGRIVAHYPVSKSSADRIRVLAE